MYRVFVLLRLVKIRQSKFLMAAMCHFADGLVCYTFCASGVKIEFCESIKLLLLVVLNVVQMLLKYCCIAKHLLYE